MKSILLITALLMTPIASFSAGLPECTSTNEGQTMMLEDGQGAAQVYVCHQGAWIPASTLPKAK